MGGNEERNEGKKCEGEKREREREREREVKLHQQQLLQTKVRKAEDMTIDIRFSKEILVHFVDAVKAKVNIIREGVGLGGPGPVRFLAHHSVQVSVSVSVHLGHGPVRS